jgi:phage terminase large subunit GpA-like protein
MPSWQDVLSYAYGRWIWVSGAIVGVLLIDKAVKAAQDRWQSHLKHVDTKVIACMEEHARTAQTEGSKSRTVADICKATGLSEKQVTKSLHRLQREHKVWEHGQNYFVI